MPGSWVDVGQSPTSLLTLQLLLHDGSLEHILSLTPPWSSPISAVLKERSRPLRSTTAAVTPVTMTMQVIARSSTRRRFIEVPPMVGFFDAEVGGKFVVEFYILLILEGVET